MRILLDTNVLCRLAEEGHALHATAEAAVRTLHSEGDELCLVPQVLYEYWVVVTRPVTENGWECRRTMRIGPSICGLKCSPYFVMNEVYSHLGEN